MHGIQLQVLIILIEITVWLTCEFPQHTTLAYASRQQLNLTIPRDTIDQKNVRWKNKSAFCHL